MNAYDIYYMQSDRFRDFICGDEKPTVRELHDSHTKLTTVFADNLNEVYARMQAEHWSPNGEARELIRSKGLRHTSMSVGDVILDVGKNLYYVVSPVGFDLIF
jgi:hypothetical protein